MAGPARPCACGCGWLPPAGYAVVPGHQPGTSQPARPRRRITRPLGAVAGVLALLAVVAALPDDEPPTRATADRAPAAAEALPSALPARPAAAVPAPATAAPKAPPAAAPAPAKPAAQQPALLQPAGDGDGDSWHDTRGQEYRLGMINTPERGECYAAEATAERKAMVAGGFRATRYAVDDYGRAVSVVTTAQGVNLNVHLARHGFANDRYLARFRHENPALAAQLDRAFAAARAEGAGLWSACGTGDEVQGIAAAPPPAKEPAAAAGGSCHPDYTTCIPVQGDGSGRGAANDLDCGQIGKTVRLRVAGVDPYRLDADGDGIGCD